MADKELISVRLETDTKGRVDNYAEENGVSRSTAIRRLLEKGVDLEEAGLTVAASHKQTGEEEKETMADGGQIVRPMLNFMGGIYAFVSLAVFGVLFASASTGLTFGFIDYSWLFGMMFTSLLVVAVAMVVLATEYPEKADQFLYTSVRKVSRVRPAIFGGSKA